MVFKAYDIRGKYPQEINGQFPIISGGSLAKGTRIFFLGLIHV